MPSIKERIISLRSAIRYARDQTGDDRCWLDYWIGYRLLDDTDTTKLTLPNADRSMEICTAFYKFRRQQESRIPKRILPLQKWDEDLEEKSEPALQITLNELERKWRKHRDTPAEKLTMREDISLYKLLPEHGKVPVDFTLPPREEFLGTVKDCAGCPNFWKSHANCQTQKHNPHAWGPCK